jgi:hypothetical protein
MIWIKRFSIAVSILAFLALVFFYSVLYFIGGNDPFDDKAFDKQVWVSMHDQMLPDNPRGQMYQDIIENHVKLGMSKVQVLELLGTPDFKNEINFVSYNLGMWSGMGMDYDSFDLYFSKSGVLTKTRKVQH